MGDYRIIVVVTLLALVSYSTCLEPNICNSKGPLPLKLVVDGCTKEPCTVYNGIGAKMNITFESLNPTKNLEVKVRAFLGLVSVDYPMPGDLGNACNYLLNGYCPLEKGEILIYNLNMPLDYPAIPVTLEFSLVADKKEVFQCFRLRISVRNPPSNQAVPSIEQIV